MNERATFNLLWDMWNELEKRETYHGRSSAGTIISRYAGVIDDRVENSGHSRSTLSLKLYTDEQLQEELDSRKDEL